MKLSQVDIGSTFGSPFGQTLGLGDLVSVLLSNAFVLAGIILLFIFVAGGLSMVIGAGQDSPEKASKGKQATTSAVIGFIIIFVSYWIIKIVEILTEIDILDSGL